MRPVLRGTALVLLSAAMIVGVGVLLGLSALFVLWVEVPGGVGFLLGR